MSYERFHEKAERIVRIVEDEEISSRLIRRATSYGPLAPALEAETPLIEKTVRVLPYSLLVSRSPEQRYQEDGFLFVDSTFFEVFSFELLRGNPESVLDAPFPFSTINSMPFTGRRRG